MLATLERSTNGTHSDEEKDPIHVIGGLKATLNNDQVSDGAKEHARTVLEQGAVERENMSLNGDGNVDPKKVEAGLKAALHNPNVSDVTKAAITERLEGNVI